MTDVAVNESRPVSIDTLPPIVGKTEAAAIAGCSPSTIARWVAEGRLHASRAVAAGSSRVRIRTSDLLVLLGIDTEQREPRHRRTVRA